MFTLLPSPKLSLTALGGTVLSAFFPIPDEHIPCGEASWVKKKKAEA